MGWWWWCRESHISINIQKTSKRVVFSRKVPCVRYQKFCFINKFWAIPGLVWCVMMWCLYRGQINPYRLCKYIYKNKKHTLRYPPYSGANNLMENFIYTFTMMQISKLVLLGFIQQTKWFPCPNERVMEEDRRCTNLCAVAIHHHLLNQEEVD